MADEVLRHGVFERGFINQPRGKAFLQQAEENASWLRSGWRA
jgi:hypothetical protein